MHTSSAQGFVRYISAQRLWPSMFSGWDPTLAHEEKTAKLTPVVPAGVGPISSGVPGEMRMSSTLMSGALDDAGAWPAKAATGATSIAPRRCRPRVK